MTELEQRWEITLAAADYYVSSTQKFTVAGLADYMDCEPEDIFEWFPNKEAILLFFYQAQIHRFWAMVEEIEDFGSYSFAEQFTSFSNTLLDLFNENREFVNETLDPYIINGRCRNEFDQALRAVFEELIRNDQEIASTTKMISRWGVPALLASVEYQVLSFWQLDTSYKQETTRAFIDKLGRFIQSILYARVVDDGIDLIKFCWQNGIYPTPLSLLNTLMKRIS
ncbi:MAG: hypothetical protein ACQETE_04465 [Bacteroidota bacterium]